MISAIKNAFAAPTMRPSDGRIHRRFEFSEPCRVERWGRSFPAMTRNISEGGICLDIVGMGTTTLDADIAIYLRDFAPVIATSRWSHKRTFGMQFLTPLIEVPELAGLIDTLG